MRRFFGLAVTLLSIQIVSCGAAAEHGDDAESDGASAEAAARDEAGAIARPAVAPAISVALADGIGAAELAASGERDPVLPTGPFADVASFCVKQRVAFAARLVYAQAELRDFGYEEPLAPSCAADPAALARARVTLGSPYRAITAVRYEAGFTTETTLLAQTDAGWVPFHESILTSMHNDPGCGSIVRDGEIDEVRVTPEGALVVVATADHAWNDDGNLIMRRARGCLASAGGGAIARSEPVVVAATIARGPGAARGADAARRVFDTPYDVKASGAIEPARTFDESELEGR